MTVEAVLIGGTEDGRRLMVPLETSVLVATATVADAYGFFQRYQRREIECGNGERFALWVYEGLSNAEALQRLIDKYP